MIIFDSKLWIVVNDVKRVMKVSKLDELSLNSYHVAIHGNTDIGHVHRSFGRRAFLLGGLTLRVQVLRKRRPGAGPMHETRTDKAKQQKTISKKLRGKF